jgi:hypothetical protein
MKRKAPADHPELELPGSRPLWKTGSGLFSDHYNQIVYRLYDLTPEEIKLVEGAGTQPAAS